MRRCVAVVTHLSDGLGRLFLTGCVRSHSGGPRPGEGRCDALYSTVTRNWRNTKQKTKREKGSVVRLMARADPLEEGALRRHLDEGFEALAYCMVYRFGR